MCYNKEKKKNVIEKEKSKFGEKNNALF
jgi:hypothetical protein